MMKNFNQILKQAQQMQSKVKTLQKELEKREFERSVDELMIRSSRRVVKNRR